jgi:MSHA biogenesis protein MshQ
MGRMSQIKRIVTSALLLGIGLGWSNTARALSQTLTPTSCSSVAGIGTVDWSNPGNADSADTTYATAVLDGKTSHYLKCTGFGFSIPSGATINGITVTVVRKSNRTSNGGSSDAAARLVKAGTIGTTDRSTTTVYTTSDVSEAHGSAVDLWGTTWTPADINDANFGAAFASKKASSGGAAHTVSVDSISITVNYFVCAPPSNVPVGVTCVCDTFGRSALNPSTIYGGNWAVSNSDGISNPDINSTTGLLRLTENTGYNAKAATVPSIFPAAGNYISVEFNHYAYNGTNPGADGIAVTLSDYSKTAVPGGFGGSLGYAQRTDGVQPPGFNGGWVGVALDEYGNYQNSNEGRVLGPGFIAQSVGVRGPGQGANGYRWLGGTASNPGGLNIDDHASTSPSPGYMYQVIVDARSYASGTINVSVNRDSTTMDGTNYSSLFGPFNAYNEANYALSQNWITKLVPDYWKISFTGSTGGSTNIHEIGNLRICAQTSYPATGGTASGFSAIDEAYPIAAGSTVPAYQNFQTGDIYMKLIGVPFKLWVGALTSSGISSAYSATTNKYLSVKFVDNSDNVCGPDAARTCNSACTGKSAVESGASQVISYTSSDKGAKLSSSFTLNSAWKNLIAVMRECTTSACSSFTSTAAACSADSFSVRPTAVSSVVASNPASTDGSGNPLYKAGVNFTLTATTTGIAGNASGYTGALKINNAALQAVSPSTNAGTMMPLTFPAAVPTATSPVSYSTTASAAATYSETGSVKLPGYDPAVDTTSARSIYDGVMSATECNGLTTAACDALKAITWSGVDSVSTKGDCVADSYSNTKNASGLYGCNFGNIADTTIARFIPDHFALSAGSISNRSELTCASTPQFTYMGEPIAAKFTLTAQNASNVTTKNYTGSNAKLSFANSGTVDANNNDSSFNAFGVKALDSYSSSTSVNISNISRQIPVW